MKELEKRKQEGEKDLVIRNGRLVPKKYFGGTEIQLTRQGQRENTKKAGNHTKKKESLKAQSTHVTDEVQVAQHETDEVQVAQQTQVGQSTARSAPIMNKINCMYTNADSLMNKLSELKAQVTQSQPMIIGIIEGNQRNVGST